LKQKRVTKKKKTTSAIFLQKFKTVTAILTKFLMLINSRYHLKHVIHSHQKLRWRICIQENRMIKNQHKISRSISWIRNMTFNLIRVIFISLILVQVYSKFHVTKSHEITVFLFLLNRKNMLINHSQTEIDV
jgi:hypothetical protein